MGVFLPHLPAAGAGDGLHQLRSDPELQQLVGDQHVAAGPGPVFADRDLLPVDADNPVAAHLARHPAVASSIRGARDSTTGRAGATGLAEADPCWSTTRVVWNRSAGVASLRAWEGYTQGCLSG